ncbi:hypothetical protein JYU34_004341 [Plutella xylostella]|uniref:FLYWCH-type domain-containing protein n=1 Tax=Plutella xylostella TaxID=51655 RepID=A0ABQ7QXQ6_PLUXY|nr:hypothetical protein JYU34_004341 [Plutella xylostella]
MKSIIQTRVHFIELTDGQNLVLVDGFSYKWHKAVKNGRRYRCVKTNMCNAHIYLYPDGTLEKQVHTHTHKPNTYKRMASGKYFKI